MGNLLKSAVSVLHITSSTQAEEFYCNRLGFKQNFAYRPFPGVDPCYMGLTREGVQLHLSSFSGDGVSGGVVVIYVEDVDALYAEFATNNVPVAMKPTDQSWGMREMYVRDSDANSLRFVQNIES